MNYFNLKILVQPKKDLVYDETYEKLSHLISQAMIMDDELKEKHEENTYKHYVFCNLYPIEKDLTYKSSNIYTFDLRSMNRNFIIKIKQFLSIINNEDFKIIMSNIESQTQRKINKLITLTPAIFTSEKGYLVDALEFAKKRILDNTQKKYKDIYSQEISIDFIKNIKQTNLKPIKIKYKGIFLLGYKFEIEVNEDPASQSLAYINLAEGCGEKNAIGFGFCKAE